MRRLGCCADRLATAHRIDHRLQRDLDAIHRLLSLADVGDPDAIETAFFLDLDPDSPEVGRICRLTDRLDDLLRELDAAGDPQPPGAQGRAARATWHFARPPDRGSSLDARPFRPWKQGGSNEHQADTPARAR